MERDLLHKVVLVCSTCKGIGVLLSNLCPSCKGVNSRIEREVSTFELRELELEDSKRKKTN